MSKIFKFLVSRYLALTLLTLPGVFCLVIPALTDSLGFNPLQELLHRTGQIAVWTLAAVLSLTPLKTVFAKSHWASVLNRHRRAVGVAAFLYALLHVTCHFLYEGEFRGYLTDVWKPFFLAGTTGFLILLTLAATSNEWSLRRMGYRLWKWIHRLAYIAALILFYHQGTSGKGNWPAAQRLFVPLAMLELLRIATPFVTRLWTRIKEVRHDTDWISWREFEVLRREVESETITSFHLSPVDQRPLPTFKPGQFLTVEVAIPNQEHPAIRTYTISDAPCGETYRLSIKREIGGLVSNFFHDAIVPGSRLRAKAPAGDFCLEPKGDGPMVLISAGVGITPMIAMLNALAANRVGRPVWFFHGARNRREHAFGPHVRALAYAHPHVRAFIAYSQPRPEDLTTGACEMEGRMDLATLKRVLPGNEGDFYLCGPGAFMKELHSALREWGVPAERIRYESFGPATLNVYGTSRAARARVSAPSQVEFIPAVIRSFWDDTETSLLDLALASGLKPPYGCKSGVCGSCSQRLVSGEVSYKTAPAQDVAPGSVLLCCASPLSDVVIELAG